MHSKLFYIFIYLFDCKIYMYMYIKNVNIKKYTYLNELIYQKLYIYT